MQIKNLGTDCLYVIVLLFFLNLGGIQTINGQVMSGRLLEQIWQNKMDEDDFSNEDSISWGFQEGYVTKYIRKQIYGGGMLRRLEFSSNLQSKYMPHTFSLKYQLPQYKKVVYHPVSYSRKALKNYQEFIGWHKSGGYYSKLVNLDKRPINQVMAKAAINSPFHVEYLWNDIPDVSNVGKRRLSRRAVEKSISTLLPDTFNTKPNLEQIVIKKSPWKFEGTENVQLSQGYLENWTKGGENNIALSSDLRFKANFTKGKHSWENNIIHKVGVISTESESGRVNDDLLEINTKYGLKSSKKWYYSFLYNFKTQVFYGYEKSDKEHETPISGFLAPAYMSFAVGMDFKPSNKFTLLLSPLTSRLTIVSDTVKFNQTRYGIDNDKKTNTLNGLSIVNNFSYQISKEINLNSKLDIFYQYLSDDSENQKQIDWEIIVDMKINQFLSTRLLGNLRYFTTESDMVQIKENFNIAFKYHF
nr:DUF3078 domain-containing protein [uncultured Carboxylicivirga sp.]